MSNTIAQLKALDREGCYELLKGFKKANLLELAKAAGITVNRSANKSIITGQIVNYYGYSKLHRQMAERPDTFR